MKKLYMSPEMECVTLTLKDVLVISPTESVAEETLVPLDPDPSEDDLF